MLLLSFWLEMLVSTLVLLVSLYLYFRSKNPSDLPTNWPILHMFPSFVANLHNSHDYLTTVLAGSGRNFRAHGPPGTGMRFFITGDPANVRHIFTTNQANFPKGEEFRAVFDVMAGSLFTTDGATAHQLHTNVQKMFSSQRMVGRLAACCCDKVENGLLPILNSMATIGTSFNLQTLMARCMFDLTTLMVFGIDPGLLSSNMPPMDASDAMDTVMEVGFIRNALPSFCWKAMRWLDISPEGKLRAAQTVLRSFVAEIIECKTMNGGPTATHDEEEKGWDDVISSRINDPYYAKDDLLCATLIGSMLSGRDSVSTTLSWIFYNLARNPDTVSMIRNELAPIASGKIVGGTGSTMLVFKPEETKSLVYLRATLYETLRLYPPVPLARKTVAFDDIMPSGHEVHARDTILISVISMGRMEDIWGKDCLDYNPDRWLSEDGDKLRDVSSHKFLAFNSGPRSCPGREIAVMQMKTIVAAVVWNFDMELVEGQNIKPKMSCILQMKNGLTVKLKRREM